MRGNGGEREKSCIYIHKWTNIYEVRHQFSIRSEGNEMEQTPKPEYQKKEKKITLWPKGGEKIL